MKDICHLPKKVLLNFYQEVYDENKENNFVDNLEWCTRSYNVNYGSGTERGIQKLKKIVCQYVS